MPRTRIEHRERGDRNHRRHGSAPPKFFGNTVGFWLNLQSLYDTAMAKEAIGKELGAIEPYTGGAA